MSTYWNTLWNALRGRGHVVTTVKLDWDEIIEAAQWGFRKLSDEGDTK